MGDERNYEELLRRIRELEKESAERELLMEALRGRDKFLQDIFDGIQDGISVLDRDFTIMSVNKWIEQTHQADMPVVGKKCYQVYQKRQTICPWCPSLKALSTGEVRVEEVKVPLGDSASFWIELSAYPLKDEHGKITGVIEHVKEITDRKQSEAALRDSEEKFRVLAEQSPNMIFINKKGRVVYANKACEEITGYSMGEFYSPDFNFMTLIAPESKELVARHFKRYLAGEDIEPCEYRIISKDGKRSDVINSPKLINYEGEKAILGIVTDITKQKQMEKALRESETRHRELADSLPQVVFEMDEEGKITFANRNAFDLFGYTVEEFEKGFTALGMLIPEDRDRAKGNIRKALEGESGGGIEYTAQRKDGRRFPVVIYSTPVRRENRAVGLRGIMIDRTDRKRTEEALQVSESKFRNLFDFSPQPIAVTEVETGKLVDVNYKFCTLFGFKREELLGRTVTELGFYSLNDRNRFLGGIRSAPEVLGLEMDFTAKDGSTFNAQMFARLIEISGENHILTIFHDITERKRLETQLQQAQKMEAIGTLAGGVAHDFNNLLMGIRGYASLVALDIYPDHPHAAYIRGIEEMVRRGADLTKQLLGFARRGKYEVKPADLNELIEKSSQWFGRTKKEITIQSKYQRGIWPVEVDTGQIEQVLLNLYVNAWQAMPDGGELHLETRNLTLDQSFVEPFKVKPGKYVRVTVTDTGVGMDEDTRKRVFDPFFTTKEMGKGTGLGLASAYGIIMNHGGIIDVQSERGEGTTFSIYLPASEKEITREGKVADAILKGNETILLVDDEEMILSVNEAILGTLGYTTLVAKNGKEAVEIYQKNRNEIDMAILDMIMPVMSGGELYDRLKEMNPALKVLLSSGYSMDDQAQAILDRGCDGFIQKPFDKRGFSQKIREILDKAP